MTSMTRLAAMAATAALAMQLVGCAQLTMSPPQASIENASKLRNAGLAPAALGSFAIDAGKGSDADKGTTIRGNALTSPVNSSFSQYLGETLKVELQSAGLLDPSAGTVITGTLKESELNGGVGTGSAKLGARFVVTRASKVRYDRELTTSTTWDSPFIGATAIPLAAGKYEGLYRQLVSVLLDDAAFRKAMAKD